MEDSFLVKRNTMQITAGSAPYVSIEAGMYELFLHTQFRFSWSEYSLQHAEMWQETFFLKVLHPLL